MHILYLKHGDVSDAMLTLMDDEEVLKLIRESTALKSYEYVDRSFWSPDENQKFQDALTEHEKDFYQIGKEVTTKTTKECISWYYTWKKLCSDECKRLRAKRKKHLFELNATQGYNLRSNLRDDKDGDVDMEEEMGTNLDQTQIMVESLAEEMDTKEPLLQIKDKEFLYPANVDPIPRTVRKPSPVSQEPKGRKVGQSNVDREGYFPCRLCGKVFEKVKSRNAHMKSHAMKNER